MNHLSGLDAAFLPVLEFEHHAALRDFLYSDAGIDRDSQQIEPLAMILSTFLPGRRRHAATRLDQMNTLAALGEEVGQFDSDQVGADHGDRISESEI